MCEFDDTANTPPVEPRTYRGTLTLDNTPAPAPYLARWAVFPANPPLNPIAGFPWGNPEHDAGALVLDGVAGVRRLRSRGRQPGLALAVGPQHEDEPDRDDRREQRGVGRVLDAPERAEPDPVPADERDA